MEAIVWKIVIAQIQLFKKVEKVNFVAQVQKTIIVQVVGAQIERTEIGKPTASAVKNVYATQTTQTTGFEVKCLKIGNVDVKSHEELQTHFPAENFSPVQGTKSRHHPETLQKVKKLYFTEITLAGIVSIHPALCVLAHLKEFFAKMKKFPEIMYSKNADIGIWDSQEPLTDSAPAQNKFWRPQLPENLVRQVEEHLVGSGMRMWHLCAKPIFFSDKKYYLLVFMLTKKIINMEYIEKLIKYKEIPILEAVKSGRVLKDFEKYLQKLTEYSSQNTQWIEYWLNQENQEERIKKKSEEFIKWTKEANENSVFFSTTPILKKSNISNLIECIKKVGGNKQLKTILESFLTVLQVKKIGQSMFLNVLNFFWQERDDLAKKPWNPKNQEETNIRTHQSVVLQSKLLELIDLIIQGKMLEDLQDKCGVFRESGRGLNYYNIPDDIVSKIRGQRPVVSACL